ncbi:MAG: ArsR family transcriptional regulator [Actinobacteria bacterium]|nr:ArsR family transcriptional regulator [Actinomycetota bacterium]
MTVETTLSALADETRRGTVEALGGGPLSAGQLATQLEVTPAALSGHLRILRGAGLVSVALDPDDTRVHVYSIEPGPFHELSDWAQGASKFWTDQLGAFARQVERRGRGKR